MSKETGRRAGYSIVQWSHEFDPSLADLLALLPELVIGRHVAIASCDSGEYSPSSWELADGWQSRGKIAISPRITSVSALPMPGFDEWYVYEECPVDYAYQSFVNRFGFSPLAFDQQEAGAFWVQVEATQPVHVLGAGTPVMFVATRDEYLFERARQIG